MQVIRATTKKLTILVMLCVLSGFSLPSRSDEVIRVVPNATTWVEASQELLIYPFSATIADNSVNIGDSGVWLHVDLRDGDADIIRFTDHVFDRYQVFADSSDTLLYDSGLRNPDVIVWIPRTRILIGKKWGDRFFLRIDAPAKENSPFEILSFEEYEQSESPELINNGMYYGSIILMSVFSLILSIFNKDQDAWKLGISLFTWFLLSFAVWGYGNTSLPYNLHEVLSGAINQLTITASLASAWFSKHFLAKSAGHSLVYKGLKLSFWAHVTYLFGSFIFGISWLVVIILVLVTALIGSLTALVAVLNKDKAARYFLASSCFSVSPFIAIWFNPMSQQTSIAIGMSALILIMLALMQRVGERSHELGRQAKVASERERFLASMSHEIRTPLNGIIGFSELCSQEDLKGDVKHYFHQIDRSSKMLLGIVNDVLDYSKLQAIGVDLVSESMSVKNTLEDVITINKPVANLNNISLSYEIADNVDEFIVTDPFRCAQILINLCGNAVKFSSNGNVEIKVFREKNDIFFNVIDDGIGIEEDVLAGLFSPFSQADASTARTFGGTGLGLAISKQLCTLLDGELTAVSKKNKGSTFSFKIPYQAGKAPISTANADVEKLAGKSVLLAEDNEVNTMLATRILEKNGLTIDSAIDGKIAFEKAAQNDYDFILMDMQMPEMTGTQATQKIRELGIKCPIIAMTANTSKSDREECLKAGMNDYLPKPIEQQELLKKLELWSTPSL